MSVKKVILNNNVIMSVEDTTAVESDVAYGKVFYKSNGDRAVGNNKAQSQGNSNITATKVDGGTRFEIVNPNTNNRDSFRTDALFTPTFLSGKIAYTQLANLTHMVEYRIIDGQTGYNGGYTVSDSSINFSCWCEPLSTDFFSNVSYQVLSNKGVDITTEYLNEEYPYYCAYQDYVIDSENSTTLQQSYIAQIPNEYKDREGLISLIQNNIKVVKLVFTLTEQSYQNNNNNNTINFVGIGQATFTQGQTWAEWIKTEITGIPNYFGTQGTNVIYTAPTGTGNDPTLTVANVNASDLITAGDYYFKVDEIPTATGKISSDSSLYTITINEQEYKIQPSSTLANWVSTEHNRSGYSLADNTILFKAYQGTPMALWTAVGLEGSIVNANEFLVKQDNLSFDLYVIEQPQQQ